MAAKNFTFQQNGDILYPKTTAEQVENLDTTMLQAIEDAGVLTAETASETYATKASLADFGKVFTVQTGDEMPADAGEKDLVLVIAGTI